MFDPGSGRSCPQIHLRRVRQKEPRIFDQGVVTHQSAKIYNRFSFIDFSRGRISRSSFGSLLLRPSDPSSLDEGREL